MKDYFITVFLISEKFPGFNINPLFKVMFCFLKTNIR